MSDFDYAKKCINKIAQSSTAGSPTSIMMVWEMLNTSSRNRLTDRAFELLQEQHDMERLRETIRKLLRENGFAAVELSECAQEGVPLRKMSRKVIIRKK